MDDLTKDQNKNMMLLWLFQTRKHILIRPSKINTKLVLPYAGCEVKSIRNGHMTIHESYIRIIDNEIFLVNATILPYEQGNRHNLKQNRDRKLLLHRREIEKISQALERQGMIAVPTKVYLKKNRFKVEIGVGTPKTI